MSTPKRVLVLQHVAVEHPGIFRQFLVEDGHTYQAVELDEGESLPALDGFQALWVMGGPMDVWEEAEYPWLVSEKALIREAVIVRRMPYLGFCLGHQLLGEALGGQVSRARESEVGIMSVQCTEAGQASPFLAGIPTQFEALQWHGAEVSMPPPGALVLASSPRCAIQILSVGSAFSMQFHVEITDTTVTDWNDIPEYASALEQTLGSGGAEALTARARQEMPVFNRQARQLYQNWKQTSGFG